MRGRSKCWLPDHQIIPLADQRNEVQPKHACGGLGREATIHSARLHLPSCWEMARSGTIITPDATRGDSHLFQPRIEESPAAGTFFSIHDGNIFPGKIINASNALRVAPCREDTLFPDCKRDYSDGVFGKQTANLRQIGFASGFIS